MTMGVGGAEICEHGRQVTICAICAPERDRMWREQQNVTAGVKAPTYAELQAALTRVTLEKEGLRLPFLAMVDAIGGEVTISFDDITKAHGMAFVMTQQDDGSWHFVTVAKPT